MDQDTLQKSSSPSSQELQIPLIISQNDSNLALQVNPLSSCYDAAGVIAQKPSESSTNVCLNIKSMGLTGFREKNESPYLPMSNEDGLKSMAPLSTSGSENNSPVQFPFNIVREAYYSSREESEERSPNLANDSISIEMPLLNNIAPSHGPNIEENTNISLVNRVNISNQQAASSEGQSLVLHNNHQFYKPPIFKILTVTFGLFLLSDIFSGFIEGNNNYTNIFPILYIIEVFFLAEEIQIIVHSYAPNRPNFSAIFCGEVFYHFVDSIAVLFVTIAVNIHLSTTFGPSYMLLYFVAFLVSAYCACCKIPFEEKSKRFLFIIQMLGILLKVHMEIPLSWNIVLCFSWIFLTSLFLKLFEFFIQVMIIFAGDVSSRISKLSKIVTIIGIFLLAIDLAASLVVVMLTCSVLDEANMTDHLKRSLIGYQYLNLFVFLYAIATFKPLMEFLVIAVAIFNTRVERLVQTKEFVLVRQDIYLKKLSPTYYKILDNADNREMCKTKETDENNQEGDVDMCYICYGKTADGVIVDCGHGGICYDCLKNYVKLKDECMECRREIASVLRIENNKQGEGEIFKSKELYRIIKV